MSRPIDVLKILQRTDKHYLGAGARLLWAPLFPNHLDAPGLWDCAQYYDYELQPLFTWSLLDEDGVEVPLRLRSRFWDPSSLTQLYSAQSDRGNVTARETKCILSNDVAACEITLTLRRRGKAKFHLVAWTAQENISSGNTCAVTESKDGTISFSKEIRRADIPPLRLGAHFALNRKPHSLAVQLSEGSLGPPRWALSPFYEKFNGARLPDTVQCGGISEEGVLFMALHSEVVLSAGKEERLAIALGVSPSVEESRRNLRTVLKDGSPAALSVKHWNEYFGSLPRFNCSDPYLRSYYWYRWYGLHLNTIPGGEGNYPHSDVCQGIADSRAPISYSAPAHMRENRWRNDPALAQGSLLTFLANQRQDGGFRGRVDIAHERAETFYHANWGNALLALQAVHPAGRFLREAFEGLSRYARYFDRERDSEGSGLYDIENHCETGQQYMHRYSAVISDADRNAWGKVFRLKGVDATVYMYELKRALAAAMRALGKPGEAELWEIEADKIRSAVRSRMWSPSEAMFFDVDPVTGNQTMVKAATCFYPYFTDIVSAEHIEGLKRHLLNATEFWPAYPVSSSSLDDKTSSAEGEWKGKRMNGPWNGRVWPMTNSHIAEALGHCAIAFEDSALRRKTADFIGTFIRMMFFDADAARANCFEHYNPVSGKPSIYRGIDDYQHSWVVDLIITYVCGIRVEAEDVIIDPFPFSLAQVSIDDVLIQGRRIRVEIRQKKFSLWIDGAKKAESTLGRAVRLALG